MLGVMLLDLDLLTSFLRGSLLLVKVLENS